MRRGGLPTTIVSVLAMLIVGLGFATADEFHKNSFSGKAVSFVRGDDNVKAEQKAHQLSTDRSRSLPTSEYISVDIPQGKNNNNYVHYYYPVPPAPLNEDLSAEMWVHSNKSGVQMLARIVFPKERNPKQIDEALTVTVLLDTYKAPANGWQKLVLRRPEDILQAQKQSLRLQFKKDFDVTDAYIDRLVLNLYTGPGKIDVYVDNLEIGPVKPGYTPVQPIKPKDPGATVKDKDRPKDPIKDKEPTRTERGILVDYNRGKLTVGGIPAFPRFIRYTGTPLQVLKEAGFNALYMDAGTPIEVIEDAVNNYGFWVIPNLKPLVAQSDDKGANLTARDAESLVATIRKFQAGDAVLFWDFGSVQAEDYSRVVRTVEAIHTADPRRPVSADVWDGFGKYALNLDLIGNHRDPLQSSLEMVRYAEWLYQRKTLAYGSKFTWTWVQTHMPEWQTRMLGEPGIKGGRDHRAGPQPEQIRLATFLALASGSRALGFWADETFADPARCRERLWQLAILNREIEMIEPILLTASGNTQWHDTSNRFVKLAVIRSPKGVLAMPIWLGDGAQFVAPQASIADLTFVVPQVPDGAEPWEISPVRVQSLQARAKAVAGGIQVSLPEFDLASAIVFTADHAPDGLVAQWQRHTRRVGRDAAAWACDLADEELRSVARIHEALAEVGPPIDGIERLLVESQARLNSAKRHRLAQSYESAYMDAQRAMRPLRIMMRAHWERAVRGLDFPSASPFTASYYTLPLHWELARSLRGAADGANALMSGDFEAFRGVGVEGVDVGRLPGWTVQTVALDNVVMDARVIPSEPLRDPPRVRPTPDRNIYRPTSETKRIEDPDPPEPPPGSTALRLTVSPKPITLKKDERPPREPEALERTFLAVNSPPIRLQPDTWVRISGWVKVPEPIRATADGVLFYDTSLGEPMALRLGITKGWQQFHFYRKVPASGDLRVRLAVTGFGTAYFDDIRVIPLVPPDRRLLPAPAGPETAGVSRGR